MKAVVSYVDRREVEISDEVAAKIAEQVIRVRFGLADATETSPAGLLRAWHRNEHGGVEAVDGLPASEGQKAALQVLQHLNDPDEPRR